ncbi:phage tail tape measure protein [uncultured Sphingomonas sp.]|uniref:phage tail tape measure protein n=1 Tax=uncultured Sphingomonas sp. TaxID=158754 RepID=UPI0025F1FA30|nr:phage tail tape measure protein [uncultured Sphingomonas sp.]
MQQLLASLVVAMSVKDAAFETGMRAARANVRKTGQDMERETGRMEGAFERMAERVNRAMVSVADAIADAGRRTQIAGAAMTAAVTIPLTIMGRRTKDTAADFQTSMNKVRAAMLTASPAQIEKLSEAALKLGPAMGRSAIEAADAIEMLAKNGMSAATILNGGLASSLTLATVGQSNLSDAADLTTDIVSQFTKTSSDLPDVVNKVSGALDVSKMAFDDYRLAIGQAGGVAGGLGFAFEDLNVALAATAPLFASGSDAGTSFKTFLTSLSGNSKEAQGMIKELGLQFFDAEKNARGLSDIAEELRTKLSNLDDATKQDVLKTIFGTDAIRTAIGLMNMGAEGIDNVRKSIDAISADDKMTILLDGHAAASQRLASAAENLSIKFGQVLLPVFTAVKDALAAVLNAFANAPSWFHTLIVVAGAAAAAMGPLILAVTVLAKTLLPLLLLRLGPVAMAFAALVNPVGVIVRLLGALAMQAGAATAIGILGSRLVALAGPLGLAVSLLTLLAPLLFQTAKASNTAQAAQEAATAAMDKAAERTNQLASATGKLRKELIEKAKADARAAAAALKAAVADMAKARAALARAKAEQAANYSAAAMGGSSIPGTAGMMRQTADNRVANAEAELKSSMGTVKTWVETVTNLVNGIREAKGAVDTPTSFSMPDDDDKKKGRTKKGRDAARDEAQYLDELDRLRVEALDASADLTESIEARYRATMAGLDADRAAYARGLAIDEGLNEAQRAELLAAKDAVIQRQRDVAEQERSRGLAQQTYDLDRATNEAAQEVLRARIDLVDSAAARREGELRLLALQRQQEEADIELILATKASASAEYSNALARKGQLDRIYGDRAAAIGRDTEGPMERYRRELNMSAEAVNESIEAIQVQGFDRLGDWMSDAVTGARNLKDAFADMATSMVRDLARIFIQQNLIRPLAGALFGGNTPVSGGIPVSGITASVGGVLSYGGGKASGGRVSPSSWYMVGENGPEPFVPDTAGTILPNSSLRGGRGGGVVEVRLGAGELFEPVVETISGGVTARVVRGSNQQAAMSARQSLRG